MTTQNLLLAGVIGLATLTGCAPMDTRDHYGYDDRGMHQPYDGHGYQDGPDYRNNVDYVDDRDYQQGPAYSYSQAGEYRDDGRRDANCEGCGVVRNVTRFAGGRRDNTGAIVVGAVVGGALGNTVGSGDGRRAATVVGAVAGGAVANNLTRDNNRHDVYRIDVQMNDGDVYSFDQHDHEGLREGSPVQVRDGHVYPLY